MTRKKLDKLGKKLYKLEEEKKAKNMGNYEYFTKALPIYQEMQENRKYMTGKEKVFTSIAYNTVKNGAKVFGIKQNTLPKDLK